LRWRAGYRFLKCIKLPVQRLHLPCKFLSFSPLRGEKVLDNLELIDRLLLG
jgi:hypothetical protein